MQQQVDVAIGLDVGTSGVRALAIDFSGRLVAQGRASYGPDATTVAGPRVEQDSESWSLATQQALRQLSDRLPAMCHIVGVAVDATSGTFLLVDATQRPLTRGIMYSDQRAVDEAPDVAAALAPVLDRYGIRIASSFALSKIVHLIKHDPALWKRCHRVVHQTDWIVGMLCGRYDVTDISTALKTGADPGQLLWSNEIERLGISRARLPAVVLPGTEIGRVTPQASAATGLPRGVPVIAGCTDGTAGCLASGAAEPGDLNVTLGTTLVFKAVALEPLLDPDGMIYNHRHPAGGFLPGAASNTGAEWIERDLSGCALDQLEDAATGLIPTNHVVYPLKKTGERFPFPCPQATGFGLDQIDEPAERFAAGLEAVAFLERMGIERLEGLGLPIGPRVFATGGATAAELWLRIRATVNRRVYCVPRYPDCAVGTAVLAAMPTLGSYAASAATIVQNGHLIEPNPDLAGAYDDAYARFREALWQRGYVPPAPE